MHRPSAIAALVMFLALARPAWAASPTDDDPLEPRSGVLLLRNGEIIAGTISLTGDEYDVALAGGEIRIKTAEVDLFCASAEECYERKRDALDSDKVDDRLDLAQWCLRHRLLKQAAQEISAAVALDPSHPKIALLERRVRMMLEEPARGKKNPAGDKRPLLAEELDRMTRGMPPGSVETFTQVVQPMLLNHCATAGCHGPQSPGQFHLLRVPAGKAASRRSTQRNLYATLGQINHQQPEVSPLLTAPIRAHGSTKAAIFTDREASRYKQLVAWVGQVASYRPPSGPQTIGELPSPLLQSVGTFPQPDPARSFGEPAPALPAVAPPSAMEKVALPALRAPGRPERAKSGAFTPRDAFDAEIFNRMP